MPGIPLVTRETMTPRKKIIQYAIQSRTGGYPCCQDSRPRLSAEEEIAAEESLSIYCKPVELYNILQRRAIRNPLFLQRCLHYKLQAKHCRRIQMTFSFSEALNDGIQIQSLYPVHIVLARQLSDVPKMEHSAVYRYTKARVLTTSTREGANLARATFILPEMNELAKKVNSESLFVLFISYGGSNGSSGYVSTSDHSAKDEKPCLWGKISMESLFLSWEKFPTLNIGRGCELLSTVDLVPSILKTGVLGQKNCMSFQIPNNRSNMNILQQVQVTIYAEEQGATESSAYNLCTSNNIHASSSSRISRLRTGNVIFNYRYYHNKLQRTEVTENFSCPFCLLKCASFKGLKLHLLSSHDLFNFEFWITDEYQAVNLSVKMDPWKYKMAAGDNDPQKLIFLLCCKPLKRKSKNLIDKSEHLQPPMTSDLHAAASELLNKADDALSSRVERAWSSSVNDSQNAVPDPDCIQSIAGSSLAPPVMLQFAKTRKLERSDCRSRALLEKRQFFHSQRAQPMALEQVISDHDSEDEVDDDVADLEDRRLLDDFVDVTKEEKQIMHLWNSFLRKQRVLADGHIPWACEGFSRLHGPDLVQAPPLIWCWRLFMIKLWNHGLLDARSINNCNIILEQCQKQEMNPVLPSLTAPL